MGREKDMEEKRHRIIGTAGHIVKPGWSRR